ncbi:DUF3106 domain-containing protein [Pelomonas sp. KK5]|uniref:DUF3106 domain-containing protein n=1 Tax=Pelomonas sp. KK5 TaxID=1855730 RepID=UPI0009F9E517|nr:DUF3106 domain-containing protein [Pelomonas sp. KK5]
MSKSDSRGLMPRFRLTITFLALSCAFVALISSSARAQSSPDAAASAPSAVNDDIQPAPWPPVVAEPPVWARLSLVQQWALKPLERDWDSLDTARRTKWLDIAQRFPGLPREEQLRMHERMRAWARLSPAERQQARLGYQSAQQIKADDRQAKWEAYQALSPEERQKLAERAAARRQEGKAKAPKTDNTALAKSNLVPAQPKTLAVRPVSPSVLQAKPGATTVLITETGAPPRHQQAGQTKVFADPDLVDSKTLLPKRRLAAASHSSS